MHITVSAQKRGRIEIVPSYAAPEEELRKFAHMVKEYQGVKRAIVRDNRIYLRIDVSVAKLRQRIVRAAKAFFNHRHLAMAAKRGKKTVYRRPYARRSRLPLPATA